MHCLIVLLNTIKQFHKALTFTFLVKLTAVLNLKGQFRVNVDKSRLKPERTKVCEIYT